MRKFLAGSVSPQMDPTGREFKIIGREHQILDGQLKQIYSLHVSKYLSFFHLHAPKKILIKSNLTILSLFMF